ncbi:hypothetical protein BOTBODRAFT_59248 [Botryobasidium botryosum FD-172 SS1]|uniref:Uncharacterized protein n=1 Tax=Botryobasidium botryosum (strain FD-172 SS1) TaxID=930990 RepID=A0A067LZ25_BOTB1|nr:hypothetical protein BOTBODRAFT_59248 [Botryobasidium botryosum FD-172 SS1]
MTSEAIARATEIDAGFASTASLTETPVVPVGVTPSIPVPASPVLGPVLEPTVVDPAPSVSEPTHTSTTESALIADALTTIAPSAPRSSTTSTPKVTNDEREYPCCATGPPSGSRTPYFVLPEADAVPEVEEDTSGWTVVGRRRRPRAVDVKGKGRAPPELGVSA